MIEGVLVEAIVDQVAGSSGPDGTGDNSGSGSDAGGSAPPGARLLSTAAASASTAVNDACSFEGATRFKEVVLFHVAVTVVLTLLINAPSTGMILRRIGLTKLSDEKARAARPHLHPAAPAAASFRMSLPLR